MKSDDWIFVFVALTFGLLPTGTAPPLISIGIAFSIWIFSGKFFQAKEIIKQPWFWPVIPFAILPWIGLLYSQNLELALDYALKTKYWLFVFLTAGIDFTEKRISILIQFLWVGLFIGVLLAVIQFFGFMAPIRKGFLGFGVVHTLACMYLLIGILMVSFYFKKETQNTRNKILLLCLLACFFFHLTVLRGRSGYLVFGILSPFIAHNLMYRFSLFIKSFISILLVVSLLLSPVVRNVISETFINLIEQKEKIIRGENIETMPRPYIIRESVGIFKEHPFLGVGTGSLFEITKAKGPGIHHPHNNFLYMGVSFGILGIAACFWLFFKVLKLSWRKRESALGYFIFSSGIVLFLGGMLDTQILNTGTLLFLTLTYGMINCLGPEIRN